MDQDDIAKKLAASSRFSVEEIKDIIKLIFSKLADGLERDGVIRIHPYLSFRALPNKIFSPLRGSPLRRALEDAERIPIHTEKME